MTTKINARIASLVRARGGKVSQNDVVGCGFTKAEIEQAVKAGAVKRIGSQMGLTTLFYLSI